MSDECMTLEEQKQVLIDNYINLMRIKAHEQGINTELEYQIKVAKVKLSTFGKIQSFFAHSIVYVSSF